MPRNPLRRLSVALRLQEAYLPSPVAEDPTPSTSLSHFLATSKADYLKDIAENPSKGGEWTVVMGNEAGDLDSIASAIGYAWILSTVHKQRAVPLIQSEREDLVLRAENIYALSTAGVSSDQAELLTLTDLKDYKPFPSHTFALVDHNRLGALFTDTPSTRVTAILDHHEDEGAHLDAKPRTITPCGSCSSLVGALLPQHYPAELATLLLFAILIDTNGLKPGGKATDVDRRTALAVSSKSTYSNRIPPPSALAPIDQPNPDALFEVQTIKDINTSLQDKKSDVSHLSALDLLRRDYKEYTYKLSWAKGEPTIKAGLSTVPVRLKDWGTKGKLERAALEWMRKRGLTVLGILTSFRHKKTKAHKRETAWIVLPETELDKLEVGSAEGTKEGEELTVEVLAKRLWDGLEASGELELKKHKKFDVEKGEDKLPKRSKAKVYKQGNANATRKAIAPVLKKVLEGDNKPSETTSESDTAPKL